MDLRPPHDSDSLLSDNGSSGKTGNAMMNDPTKFATGRTQHSEDSLIKTTKAPRVSTALKAWSIDALCCLVAVLALAAIIITLAIHNGNSLPSWPLGITINALISVFSVIFKVTLLVPVTGALSQLKWSWFREPRPLSDMVDFDDASRGNLWSSLVLIVKTRGVRLPALGAFIMITAIAIDPFVQQVVRYDPCPLPVWQAQATTARTNNFTLSGVHTGAMLESLDAPMQAAIYKGVYNAWSHVTPECTTGNCTFPDFRSVGMCGHCDDITSEIQYTPNLNLTTSSVWSLASGLWVGYGNPYVLNMTSYSLTTTSTPFITTEVIAVTNYTTYQNYADPSSNANKNQTIPAKPWRPSGPNFMTAARCSLRPCIRTTHVEVNSSTLTETTLSSSDMEHPPLESDYVTYWSWVASPMPCLINGSYFEASEFIQSNVTNATHRWPVQGLLPNNQTAWLPNECYFTYASTLGLGQYLESFLSGTMLYAPESQYGSPGFIEQLWNMPSIGKTTTDGNTQSSESTTAGSSFELINSTWISLVESMSSHIRDAGDSVNSAPAVGVALQTGTCLIVRWPWLSYLIALLALTIILFIGTATGSFGRRQTHQLWRDSPLALLFHGLDENLRSRARGVEDKSEMKKVAERIVAKLVDEGDGAEFRRVDKDG